MVIMDQRYNAEDSTNGNDDLTSVTSLGEDEGDYLNCYHDNKQMDHMPDPFQCTLQIRTKNGEGSFLKRLYSPLLEGIDPTFQFICIEESDSVKYPLTVLSEELDNSSQQNIVCSSLSVILFLRETFGRLSALSVQKNLSSEPWRFHHRIELPLDVRPRITARQDFYQAFPELPLWAISPVHYGNEHLRFHILVKNFSQMRTFYELITGSTARGDSPGFCYIPIYTQKGLDIQISLKYLPQVFPKPSSACRLQFKVQNIDSLASYCVGPLLPYGKGYWLTNDPDGNYIVLVESDPKGSHRASFSCACQETSDYETASADTESVASSKDSPGSSMGRGALRKTNNAMINSLPKHKDGSPSESIMREANNNAVKADLV